MLTIEVIAGRGGSQAHREQALTARIMANDSGRWLIGLTGAAIMIAGSCRPPEASRWRRV